MYSLYISRAVPTFDYMRVIENFVRERIYYEFAAGLFSSGDYINLSDKFVVVFFYAFNGRANKYIPNCRTIRIPT